MARVCRSFKSAHGPREPVLNKGCGCLLIGFGILIGIGVIGRLFHSPSTSPSASGSNSALAYEGPPIIDPSHYIGQDDPRNPKLVNQFEKTKELAIVRETWELGGFNTVAIWHVTFKNNTDKPIGNIKYVTHYSDETGNEVDKCGIESFGDHEIRKVIPPHKSRSLEVNDCFVHHEAHKAGFVVVDWEYVTDAR